jgi:hypothetical protein
MLLGMILAEQRLRCDIALHMTCRKPPQAEQRVQRLQGVEACAAAALAEGYPAAAAHSNGHTPARKWKLLPNTAATLGGRHSSPHMMHAACSVMVLHLAHRLLRQG